jgi:transcriptional regulator with XRE-family HTH domain|tara:strand:+ start:2896 stop:3204 length:309 start_codon:yes stop_codon:yes gene_type:complete
MEFSKALGEVIREQRLAKNLTLRAVCEDGFVSLGHLSDIENGRKECSSIVITNIANGLGVNNYDLIIEAGFRMAGKALHIPDSPESLFVRDSAWTAQYSDLK